MAKKIKTDIKSKGMKWAEISKLKTNIDIIFEDKVLFTIRGLNDSEFNKYINIIKPEKQKGIDGINNLINEKANLANILKLMVIGIDFDDMTDDEIIQNMNNFPIEITEQINDALHVLLVEHMVSYLNTLGGNLDMFKAIKTTDDKIQSLKKANGILDKVVTKDSI